MPNSFECTMLLYAIGALLGVNAWALKTGAVSPYTVWGKIAALLFGWAWILLFLAATAVMFLVACIADIPRIFKATTPP